MPLRSNINAPSSERDAANTKSLAWSALCILPSNSLIWWLTAISDWIERQFYKPHAGSRLDDFVKHKTIYLNENHILQQRTCSSKNLCIRFCLHSFIHFIQKKFDYTFFRMSKFFSCHNITDSYLEFFQSFGNWFFISLLQLIHHMLHVHKVTMCCLCSN